MTSACGRPLTTSRAPSSREAASPRSVLWPRTTFTPASHSTLARKRRIDSAWSFALRIVSWSTVCSDGGLKMEGTVSILMPSKVPGRVQAVQTQQTRRWSVLLRTQRHWASLVAARETARESRDFKAADATWDDLTARGVEILDVRRRRASVVALRNTPGGVQVRDSPRPNDDRLEATVDAAALAEQTGSGSSWSAMRKPCLRKRHSCLRVNTAPDEWFGGDTRETSSGQRRTATRQEQLTSPSKQTSSVKTVWCDEKGVSNTPNDADRGWDLVCNGDPRGRIKSAGEAVSSTRLSSPKPFVFFNFFWKNFVEPLFVIFFKKPFHFFLMNFHLCLSFHSNTCARVCLISLLLCSPQSWCRVLQICLFVLSQTWLVDLSTHSRWLKTGASYPFRCCRIVHWVSRRTQSSTRGTFAADARTPWRVLPSTTITPSFFYFFIFQPFQPFFTFVLLYFFFIFQFSFFTFFSSFF